MKSLLPLFLTFVIWACSVPQQLKEGSSNLGDLNHQFSISSAAKPDFDQGLLLLHSFEYDDAREAFELALDEDPNEVMTYWGLAMTHYKALWGLQDVDAGRQVMKQLGADKPARLAKAENQLERDFWTGVEILYGEGELKERNQKYLDHMEQVYQANPNNHEVAAFYSLGLMWAGYDDQENLSKSSKVVQQIMKENPTHPGALHYMIHANDNPEFAVEAIAAANDYAKVAPDAAHALHMPSHIYVALGMWQEVVSSNRDSYDASLKRVEQKQLNGKARGYHSMAWLHYGHLQLGNYDKATSILEEMISYHGDGTSSKSYLIMMQNQQRIEAGSWPETLDFQDIDESALKIGMEGKAKIHFLKGLLAYDQKDAAAVAKEAAALETHWEASKLLVNNEGVALCSAGPTRYAPNQENLTRTAVVIQQIKAMAAILTDDPTSTEAALLKAVALEEEAGYDPGPPFIAYPSFEQYGDWLLEQKRFEEAIAMFDKSLVQRTNRTKALRGKLAALKALDKMEEANEVTKILQKLQVESV
ncbi:MAG: hypothetical protein R8G66_22185 [Cytophagales bacterium]|nr:hypothetical protein [Cytophagales bacterium]